MRPNISAKTLTSKLKTYLYVHVYQYNVCDNTKSKQYISRREQSAISRHAAVTLTVSLTINLSLSKQVRVIQALIHC